VQTNLTLSIDEYTLRAARKIALDRHTSVNSMVRDYLNQLVSTADERKQALEGLRALFDEKPFRMGEKNWTRDDLHER